MLKDLHSGPQDYYFQRKHFFIILSVLKLSTFSCTQAFLQASLSKLATLPNSSLNACILWQLYLCIVLHCPDSFQNKQGIILWWKEDHENSIKIEQPAFFVSLFSSSGHDLPFLQKLSHINSSSSRLSVFGRLKNLGFGRLCLFGRQSWLDTLVQRSRLMGG